MHRKGSNQEIKSMGVGGWLARPPACASRGGCTQHHGNAAAELRASLEVAVKARKPGQLELQTEGSIARASVLLAEKQGQRSGRRIEETRRHETHAIEQLDAQPLHFACYHSPRDSRASSRSASGMGVEEKESSPSGLGHSRHGPPPCPLPRSAERQPARAHLAAPVPS